MKWKHIASQYDEQERVFWMTLTIFPGLVKPHWSFHSVVQELGLSLTLMCLDFQVVFFLPIYIRKEPNTMKVGWSGKW